MITALVGGQFGSEGKGLIAGYIAREYDIHVRVGAANAGHTVYTLDSQSEHDFQRGWHKHVLQQLPCAAYANPEAILVLGAGAMISPEILVQEIQDNTTWRQAHGHPPLKVHIDWRAHVVREEHKEQEQQTNLAESIGSTSTIAKEGIGTAQAARVLRYGYITFRDWLLQESQGFPRSLVKVLDTVDFLHGLERGYNILLEGTQGTSLSNTTGLYPFVTSRCTSAMGLAADCGLSKLDEVIMVCRCHPIRVAGNSGPFWHDSEEITWSQIGIDPETERTTVTKKVRRVATFSHSQVLYNARINGATRIALTFADYVYAQIAGVSGAVDAVHEWPILSPMIQRIQDETSLPVSFIGTGPHSVII